MPGPIRSHPSAPLTRRSFLAAGTGALATWGLAGRAAAAPSASPPDGVLAPVASRSRAYAFLDVMADAYPEVNPGVRLAQSYADEVGLFSTAFVYDNALAVNAYLSAGDRYVDRARLLGDALLYAQEHDPVHEDGRLRQAYNVGPYVFYDGVPQPYGFVLPDGTANIGWQFGFLGTAVGDMAWPGIALVQLHERTGDQRYLDGALRIADWIVDNASSTRPLGGYSFGVDAGNAPVPNVSTEHNIDVVGFFRQLRVATGDSRWDGLAEHARQFVVRMWEPAGGYFYTGSNDGVTINRSPLPLDPQTWSWLALRDPQYASALDWAATALRTTDVWTQPLSQLPDGVSITGVTFSSASLVSTASYNGVQVNPDGVWLEGTGQLAAALHDRNDRGRDDRSEADLLLEQVRVAQSLVGQDQHVGGEPLPRRSGVVAASSLIDTGFGFGFFQAQHVGATSWYLMAARRRNPLQPGGLR